MQREMVWRARAGHEYRQRLAPVIAPSPATWKIVESGHGGKVARSDRCLARPHREIPWQLRPVGGLQREVFSRDRHARIGEQAARLGNGTVQGFQTRPGIAAIVLHQLGEHLQREVMLAHDEFIAGESIQRLAQLLGLGDSKIAGIGHAVYLPLQQPLAGRLGQESERLAEYEGERCRQQAVVHADEVRRRVFFDAEHRSGPGGAGGAVLDDLGAKKQPRSWQYLVYRAPGQGHLLPFAVNEQPQNSSNAE